MNGDILCDRQIFSVKTIQKETREAKKHTKTALQELKEFDLDNPNVGVSQMYILFENILPFRFPDIFKGVFA